jgi:hypothetical protein
VLDGEDYSYEADIFSLGALIFQLLEGKSAFG